MKKAISYTASLVLFVFYLFVFLNAGKTNVSQEYQMFYIDRELMYYLPENELRKYTIDKKWKYNQKVQSKNIDYGWSSYENKATWMTGEESSFYLWLDTVEKDTYWLKICTLGQIDYTRELFVNDNIIGRLETDEEGNYIVKIPGDCLKSGLNKFTVRNQDVEKYCSKNPESSDERMLTIYVKSIGLYSNPL